MLRSRTARWWLLPDREIPVVCCPSPQTASLHASRLMQAPDDLLCPIMHSLMRNPVITQAGNVYEEAAIRQTFLSRSNNLEHKDPLSNQIISDDLRPVYVLRSKAMEYATTTARRCIERGVPTLFCTAIAPCEHTSFSLSGFLQSGSTLCVVLAICHSW